MREVPFTIRIGVSGAQDISRGLMALEAHVSDLSDAWSFVDQVFHDIVRQQFASEGGHGGRPWAPLAQRTILARRQIGLGARPILRRTGTLERSLTTLNSDALSVHTALQYRRGSLVEYGVFHQRGTRTMPARPPIELTNQDKEELVRPIRVYVRQGLEELRKLTKASNPAGGYEPTTGGSRR